MAASKHNKIKLREVNRHLVCRLCRGYYVDATTIAECLHSFCRSCIIKYLEKNSFCPICEVQIHKTKPYLNLRLDKALQDVVYKVVPGLYHDEMKRRREFYATRQEQIPFATPEQCGVEERIIFSPEDTISLSLEYLESDDFESETVSSQSSESGDNPDSLSFPQQLGLMKLKNNEGKTSRRESQDVQETSYPKRYLQCPAVVNVAHLKKFIRMKHDLTDKTQVSVIHKRVPLPDHYTLMDVAYIFTWKRNTPLRFFYQIYQTKKQKLKMPPALAETEDLKSKPVTAEDTKSLKSVDEEKLSNGDGVKPSLEVKKSIKNNGDRNETVIAEPKQTVQNNILKNIDSNKPMPEIKSETPAAVIKSDGNITREPKEGFESDANSGPQKSVGNKCEKSKPSGIGETDNKNKPDNAKRKSGKVENVVSKEVKENETNNSDKPNPTTAQLDVVPSSEQCKTGVNGTVAAEEKEETVEVAKKENKVLKKTETQNVAKDSKKSSVQLLKTFRKEKLTKDRKLEIKNGKGNSLTITALPKGEKPAEKETETAKFTVEIKADNKESEYDFDGTSPPGKIIPLQEFSKYSKYSKYMAEHREKWLTKESKNSWMSLEDFREKVLREEELREEDAFKKNKKKLVPSLYKINSEGNKMRKTPNGKIASEKLKGSKTPPTIINIKTDPEDKKSEIKVEVPQVKLNSSPPPIKIENKDGEYSVKPVSEPKPADVISVRTVSEQQEKSKVNDANKSNGLIEGTAKPKEGERKESVKNAEGTKNEPVGAVDLTKTETPKSSKNHLENLIDMANKNSPKSNKNPLENLIDMANKSSPKSEEKLVEALLTAAQKQSIEPLLKIPQYSQMLKNANPQGSLSPGTNFSSSEISQALQFLEDLKSDMKVLEAKNQLNATSALDQFAQKSGSLEPYQQLYQRKIDLIKRLKRHQQILPNDADTPQRKHMKLSPTSETKKLSPTSETKKKLSPSSEQKPKNSPTADEIAQYKSSLDRTLSQIQLMELQSRMIAAHNYKNLPALLQYYNRPPTFCPGPTSPSKSNQQKTKPSSHSPNKSPQGLSSSGNSPIPPVSNSDSPFFNAQSYSHLINAGLNSEMTYHQMFQNYLSQQEQMNQVKLSQMQKKPVKFTEVSPKSISEKYYSPQTTAKK